ncbi:60S ribosomal protein L5 [Nymphaea thermarum]|nr:60S ribosomal protein L5 [Nymphaea thermarum]
MRRMGDRRRRMGTGSRKEEEEDEIGSGQATPLGPGPGFPGPDLGRVPDGGPARTGVALDQDAEDSTRLLKASVTQNEDPSLTTLYVVEVTTGAGEMLREVNFPIPFLALSGEGGLLHCEVNSSTKAKNELEQSGERVAIPREAKGASRVEDLGGLDLGDLDPPGLGVEDLGAPSLDEENSDPLSPEEEDLGEFSLDGGGLGLARSMHDPDSDQGQKGPKPTSRIELAKLRRTWARYNILKFQPDRTRVHRSNLPRKFDVSATAAQAQSAAELPLADAVSGDSDLRIPPPAPSSSSVSLHPPLLLPTLISDSPTLRRSTTDTLGARSKPPGRGKRSRRGGKGVVVGGGAPAAGKGERGSVVGEGKGGQSSSSSVGAGMAGPVPCRDIGPRLDLAERPDGRRLGWRLPQDSEWTKWKEVSLCPTAAERGNGITSSAAPLPLAINLKEHLMVIFLGALDGGLDIPHSDKRFAGFSKEQKHLDAEVHRKYIFGGHVAAYMKTLMEDEPEKYQSQFSEYAKKEIEPDAIEGTYKKVHAAIRADPFS